MYDITKGKKKKSIKWSTIYFGLHRSMHRYLHTYTCTHTHTHTNVRDKNNSSTEVLIWSAAHVHRLLVVPEKAF